ncbi:CatB-related O-acetyltransferase [Methylophaga sp.]|uniref:CatB-related O-acetyltransferase n=1 Tax=Methylophaga sp. TaxID=2024840 RepID=UPI003A8D17D5
MFSIYIKDKLIKRLLRKHGIKISPNLSSLRPKQIIEIEEKASVSNGLLKSRFTKIGAYSYIRSGYELYGNIEIGRFCSIGNNVILGLDSHQHPIDWLSTSLFSQVLSEKYERLRDEVTKVSIGHDCWIARDAVVMDGVHIGNGAIVASRAIVTKNVPPYAIVAGVPARVIKFRFSNEIIDQLCRLEWWNIDIKMLEGIRFEDVSLAIQELKFHSERTDYKAFRIHNFHIENIKND